MTYILSRNIEIVFPFKNIEAIINKYLKTIIFSVDMLEYIAMLSLV